MFDFTPLQLFYSAFQCSVTWTPAGVGVGRVGVGVVRLSLTRSRQSRGRDERGGAGSSRIVTTWRYHVGGRPEHAVERRKRSSSTPY